MSGVESRQGGSESRPGPVTRRLIRRMLALAAMAGLYFLLVGDLRGFGILTVTVAVSIFHLRSLQAYVASLDVRASAGTASIGTLLLALARPFLLAAGLLLVLLVDLERPAPLIVGVSTLPAALLAEALSRVLATVRARRAA